MRLEHWFYTIPLRLRSLVRRKTVDAELDEELQFHMQSQINLLMAKGLSPEEARHAAQRAIGGLTQIKEECRDMRKLNVLENLIQDVRYAGRTFAKSPLFTATAVLSLALGIGANTAIFSLIDAVMLKSLPVNRPGELLALTHISREGNTGSDFSYSAYLDFRTNQTFSGLFAASGTRQVDLGSLAGMDKAQCKIVSDNYFSVLGVRPILGRLLQSQDDAQPVAVISARFWKRSFDGSDSAVGRRITLEGVPFTIVGVAPGEFVSESVGEMPDLWASLSLDTARRNNLGVTWLNLMGRIKPGTTAAQAAAELNVIVSRSGSDTVSRIAVEPGARGFSRLRGRVSAPLRVLMAIVAVVLIIACANLASLLLARVATRQREIATRLAIGAGRGRIIRQLLTESLLMSAMGGVLGVLFGWWSGKVLVSLVVAGLPRAIALDLRPDLRILLFTGAISLLTGVLFGLAPALQAVRRDVSQALKLSAHTLVGRERRWRLKDALIVTQIGLSLLLLVVAGLFIGTLRNLKTQDTGFRAENVLLVQLGAQRGYRPEWPGLIVRLVERMRAIAGVQAASVSFNTPLPEASSGVYGLNVEGYTPQTSEDQRARADWVGPAYLETVGIPLFEGRDFSLADDATAPKVAIVNQTMARHYFGASRAVGRRFEFNKEAYQIVGVAKDAKYTDLRAPSPRVVYFAALQRVGGMNLLEVRTASSPIAFADAVRAAVREIDPSLRIGEITTVPKHIERKLSREYLVADISGFFGGLTLLLVSIGIYGTLAYRVAQRTNEIGIRMALGAAPASVLRMVLRDTLLWLAIGLIVGAAAVLACTRALASFLFGLTPTDSATIALASVLLITIALGASYFPARRASRVDPMAALRLE